MIQVFDDQQNQQTGKHITNAGLGMFDVVRLLSFHGLSFMMPA